MSKRKMLDVDAGLYASFCEFDDQTPEQIIENMKKFRAEIGDRDVYFHINHYGFDGGKELELRERREENDKEYEKRLKEEKKERESKKASKALKEAKELAEYERLKKKFEGKSAFTGSC